MPFPEMTPANTGARSSQRVARNSALYFLSLALPAAAALFLVPVTVRALGPARFGLLALAWALAEGTGMFDFGLGRATVRFVADATARGTERVEKIVRSSLFFQFAAGVLAGTLLFALAPLLVRSVFRISPEVKPEAVGMFRVLALHIPILFAFASLRSALEGAQRFDLSTRLKIASSICSVAIPAIAASAGYSLTTIMWLLLAVRAGLVVISLIVVSRALLPRGWSLPTDLITIREMLAYSGWVAVSTALGPVLGSLDRYVVGSIAGVAALGYYAGAAEAATRFLLIPATAFATLLPALAHTDALGERARALSGTRAARRQLAAVLLPLCLGLFVFAPLLLRLWLGPAFAAASGQALRILSIGILLTGLAHLPLALLYGSGRPDLPAKINFVQAAVHVPLTIFLVRSFGLTGGAIAWTIRCTEDLVFYEWASRSALGRPESDSGERERSLKLLFAGGLLALFFLAAALVERVANVAGLVLATIGTGFYLWYGWLSVLDDRERAAWLSLLNRRSLRAEVATL